MRYSLFIILFVALITTVILFSSCKAVKPYQRVYLNDEAMQMNKRTTEKLTSRVHTYREGASGGGKGKSSGGCGCN